MKLASRHKFYNSSLAAWALEVLNVFRVVQIRFSRLHQYIVDVPSERYKPTASAPPLALAGFGLDNYSPPLPYNWPSTGNISFNQVVMKYDNAVSNALSSTSFSIHSGEKIGIVGRTVRS